MAHLVRPEWEMTNAESLAAAITRLKSSGLSEHEIITIDRRWRMLRKLAQNPATMMGWKY